MHQTDHRAQAQGDRATDHSAQVMTTALVRYEGPRDDDTSREPQTPFAEFLDALLSRHAGETVAAGGGVRWVSFPVREALTAGCWVIVSKFAEKHRWPFAFAEQMLAACVRVDRFLSCGIALWYPSVAAAVDAFDAQVIPAVIVNLRAAPAGQPMNTLECWQLPVAQFFAHIAKRTTEHLAELQKRAQRIERANVIARGDAKIIHDDAAFDSARCTPEYIFGHHDITGHVETLRRMPKHFRRTRRLQRALAALPHRLSAVPRDALTTIAISIEETWVNTQLLLVALDAPDAEFCNASAFAPAVRALQDADPSVLMTRFRSRMGARGMTMPADCDAAFDAFLGRRIASLTQWEPDLNDQQLNALFVRMDAVAIGEMTPQDALLVACGMQSTILERVSAGGARTYDAFIETLEERVPWTQCTADDITAMAVVDVLPTPMIARGIAKMSKRLRADAAVALRGARGADFDPVGDESIAPELEAALFEAVPAGRTVADNVAMAGQLRDAQMISLLQQVFTTTDTGDRVTEDALCPELLIPLALRAPAEDLQRVIAMPKHRVAATAFIFYRLVVSMSSVHPKVTNKQVQVLRQRLGDNLWTRFVLAGALHSRLWEYESFGHDADGLVRNLRESDATADPQWDALSANRALQRLLALDAPALARVLQQHPEEEVFRWLTGANDAGVAAFVAQRDAYHARMEQEGLAPPTPRPPKAVREKRSSRKPNVGNRKLKTGSQKPAKQMRTHVRS